MVKATVSLKRWGSSLGIIIPAQLVEREGLKEKERIVIDVCKTTSLKDVFGSLSSWKADSQAMKDEARENW